MGKFMKKLKFLKGKIHEWTKVKKVNANKHKTELKEQLAEIDILIDKGEYNSEIINNHSFIFKSLHDIDKLESMENRFGHPHSSRIQLEMEFPIRLSSKQKDDMECNINRKEIKKAVWDCGTDKSPGPDVVFEKAYDSVRWDFLIDVLKKFGFGNRWCSWIQGCLISSSGSVLVNGIPTSEVQFYKGLKQGDPLSPFLFLLVMESLHLSVQRVVDAGLFRGISICPSLQLSHLFYADDAIFMGQWSEININVIVKVLDCFYQDSGLHINKNKSKLMGLAVDNDKVGGLMSRIKSWDEIVNKFGSRLSKWKMKTLSIGGRMTRIKSVLGSLPIYHMSIYKVPKKVLNRLESIRCNFFNDIDPLSKKPIWIKWNKVLAPKDKCGLGILSFYALNRALLFKWVCRFHTQCSSLWGKVIKGIHSVDGKIGKNISNCQSSIWLDIVRETKSLKYQGRHCFQRLIPPYLCSRIYEADFCSFKTGLREFEFLFSQGPKRRWTWCLEGSGEFSVAFIRRVIDDKLMPLVSFKTRWVNMVPIKVNIHAWKVKLDCLPTRLNILSRGTKSKEISNMVSIFVFFFFPVLAFFGTDGNILRTPFGTASVKIRLQLRLYSTMFALKILKSHQETRTRISIKCSSNMVALRSKLISSKPTT
nr:RNA-directed DNA polymerase, eukaryota, reverse transcriptase zinc-binding domain protein [Tanacetum cinerariifolium]